MAKLKIYIDENVDVRIGEGLRRRNIKTFSAIDKDLIGVPDKEHFEYASKLQAVIFTHDHHFLEIAKELTESRKGHWGVIYVKMNRLSVGECIKKLSVYAEILSSEEMKNQIEFL